MKGDYCNAHILNALAHKYEVILINEN